MNKKIRAQISKYSRKFFRRGATPFIKVESKVHIFENYEDFQNYMKNCEIENQTDKEWCRMCDWWWYV